MVQLSMSNAHVRTYLQGKRDTILAATQAQNCTGSEAESAGANEQAVTHTALRARVVGVVGGTVLARKEARRSSPSDLG